MNAEKLKRDFDALRSEYQVCRRKLQSKSEALLILSKDVDQCRQERDQFKLMAEQVQDRYLNLKRQIAGVGPRTTSFEGVDDLATTSSQSLAHLLCEMREVNKTLQFEVDDYKQKLTDAQGDIKLLREQIARQRVGTTDEGINTRHFPAHEREELVKQLEEAHEKYLQVERDLQQVLDEREDQVQERDAYKNKYERLNRELSYILKGDENRIIDLDALIMENRYLSERVKQMEEEKSAAIATVSKYKNLLEKKKSKSILKLGQSRTGGVVITQKQVQQLLNDKSHMVATPQMLADLQSLSGALLETVHDKNLALSHQRTTNKILGTRVAELEKKLKTLEVSGLWSLPNTGDSPNLDKLKKECNEIKTLIPQQASTEEIGSGVEKPSDQEAVSHRKKNLNLLLEDLDLLPTRERGSCVQQEAANCDESPESPGTDSISTLESPSYACDVKPGDRHTSGATLSDIDPDEEEEGHIVLARREDEKHSELEPALKRLINGLETATTRIQNHKHSPDEDIEEIEEKLECPPYSESVLQEEDDSSQQDV